MYERLLTETERYLARTKQPHVSIKHLWQTVNREGMRHGFTVPSLMDFSCLLEGDRRFELVMLGEEHDQTGEIDLLDHEEMEKLGFAGGQIVRLRPAARRTDDDDDGAEEMPDDENDMLLDRELLHAKPAIVKVKKPSSSSPKPARKVPAKKKSPAARKQTARTTTKRKK
ncbi:MAG: hypothetical protein NTV54_14420 [Ignavibacteriales bacterium]|nr:hypothetical protein [Ignavibacteriales bacterium]